MARGHKEVLTSQAECMRGIPQEMPTKSNLVAIMSEEEPRLYSQIPVEINLETSDDADKTRPGYTSRVPRVVPPSGVPLYNP